VFIQCYGTLLNVSSEIYWLKNYIVYLLRHSQSSNLHSVPGTVIFNDPKNKDVKHNKLVWMQSEVMHKEKLRMLGSAYNVGELSCVCLFTILL